MVVARAVVAHGAFLRQLRGGLHRHAAHTVRQRRGQHAQLHSVHRLAHVAAACARDVLRNARFRLVPDADLDLVQIGQHVQVGQGRGGRSLQQAAVSFTASFTGLSPAVQDNLSPAAREPIFADMASIVNGDVAAEDAVAAVLEANAE